MSKVKHNILTEEEIRPASLMQHQNKQYMADLDRILRHKKDFVYIPCPACGSKSSVRMFKKYGVFYVSCSACQTVYVNPRPTLKMLRLYYSSSENYRYWNKHIFSASENSRRNKIFVPRVKLLAKACKRYNIDAGALMEVGAGFGTFCEEVKKRRLFERVIAIEPTPSLAESCRHKGLEVIEKQFEQVKFKKNTIDVVASFEVIEHLFCPRDFLVKCNSLLKPKGLIIVTCPNFKGFDIATLQSFSNSIDIEHLNYFNPDSFSCLFSKCCFETLEVLTPGKLDAELVRKKVIDGEFSLSGQPFLKQVLVDDWERLGSLFQKFLADNLLSSHMWAVARKQ